MAWWLHLHRDSITAVQRAVCYIAVVTHANTQAVNGNTMSIRSHLQEDGDVKCMRTETKMILLKYNKIYVDWANSLKFFQRSEFYLEFNLH